MKGGRGAGARARRPSDDETNHGVGNFLSKGWWLGIGSIAAVLALVVSVVLARGAGEHRAGRKSNSPMLSEQHMVSRLVAGDTYVRLRQIIGAQPDMQQTFKSGKTLYQFNRPWEYIDLLVSGGNVLSVGVYAESVSFKPTLYASGYAVTVNGPSIERQAANAVGAVGNCGGNIGASFFEGFGLAMASQESSILFGWVNSRSMDIPEPACAATFPLNRCDRLSDFKDLSRRFLDCLDGTKIGGEIERLSPAVVIVTAPYQRILPEMFDYGPLSIGPGLG